MLDNNRSKVELVFLVALFFVVLPFLGRIMALLSLLGPQGVLLLSCLALLTVAARRNHEEINF